jgi:hypothetical protein
VSKLNSDVCVLSIRFELEEESRKLHAATPQDLYSSNSNIWANSMKYSKWFWRINLETRWGLFEENNRDENL